MDSTYYSMHYSKYYRTYYKNMKEQKKERKNFLLFTLEYPPFKGGVAHYYFHLVQNWPEDNIFVLTTKEDNRDNGTEKAIIRRPLLTGLTLPRWLPSIFSLARTIKNKRIGHILVGQILPLGLPTYICSRWYNIPYSVFLHGMDAHYALSQKRKKKAALRILRGATKVICANHYVKGVIEEYLDEQSRNKIEVVTPGLYLPAEKEEGEQKRGEDIRKEYDLEGRFILFSLGRMVKRKGFDTVVEAMEDIIKEIPNAVYVLAGTGPEEVDLYNKIQQSPTPVRERVLMLGKINEREKWDWLHACDVFIMPSKNIDGDVEGFGIVYLEANKAGKPVIGGKEGGAGEAIQDGETGLLVNPWDKQEITQAVVDLAQHPDRRKKMGEQGKKRVEEQFSWEQRGERVYKIFQDLL